MRRNSGAITPHARLQETGVVDAPGEGRRTSVDRRVVLQPARCGGLGGRDDSTNWNWNTQMSAVAEVDAHLDVLTLLGRLTVDDLGNTVGGVPLSGGVRGSGRIADR